MMLRLQKYLAEAGIASRRASEELITAGRVQVNGDTATLGMSVDPDTDVILFDGKPVKQEEELITLMLYKPKGVVSTSDDPQGRKTVQEYVKDIPARLYNVGRLDINSEGLLLMTNDGELGNFILHPRYEVNKTYEALVMGSPTREELRRLEMGVEIDGQRTRPADIRILDRRGQRTLVEVVIHEGKKRQVRKMFQAINHRVIHLKRTAYGQLRLGRLAPGKYRILATDDLKKIFSGKIPFTIKNIPA